MNQALNYTGKISEAIFKSPIPGHAALFDGEVLIGLTPIYDWNACLNEATTLNFDNVAIIAHDTIPPNVDLQAQADACNVTYSGVIYDRPRPIEPDPSPPAISARLLH